MCIRGERAQSRVRRAQRLHPLPRLHRNRACPISPSKTRSKSDKSDFDWRVGEGEAACSVPAAFPSPPSPASGGGGAISLPASLAIAPRIERVRALVLLAALLT